MPKQYNERPAITDWKNWRDIFASETVRASLNEPPVRTQLELDAYRKRTTAHTWWLTDWSVRDPDKRERAPKVPTYLSRFATLKIFTGTPDDRSWRSVYLSIEPTAQAIEVVGNHSCLVDYDTMSFDVIEWPDNRALVVCRNSKIFGGPWVAKIDASTIPAALREVHDE